MNDGLRVTLATLYSGGAFAECLAEAGIPLISLAKTSRWNLWAPFVRYCKLLRRVRPRVVYSFLPVSNVLTTPTRIVAPGTRVVWGIRASAVDYAHYGAFASFVNRVESALSWVPNCSIANSVQGKRDAVTRGFNPERVMVVANGIDCDAFKFEPVGRAKLRGKWAIAPDTFVVGMVARFDPMKGHEDFLDAIPIVRDARVRARFVCIGPDTAGRRAAMVNRSRDLNIADLVLFPDMEGSMSSVFSALDVVVSASRFGEGFSNSIAEALACERVCIATDIGDARQIVADAGWIVPGYDPPALAKAMLSAFDIGEAQRLNRGRMGRQRVLDLFSVELCCRTTAKVLGVR